MIVGGGPAGLSCAIRLMQLLADDEKLTEQLGEVPVALIEKGKTTGSHLLSGAMMHPSALQKLLPDVDESDWPTYGTVAKDTGYFMTKRNWVPLKPTPPPFRNHGNHVTSVAQLGRYLGEKAEEMGVYVLPETSGYKLLEEDGKVVGVRSGDKGRGRDGQRQIHADSRRRLAIGERGGVLMRVRPAFPELRKRFVMRNAEKPGAEPGRIVELANVLICLQKHVLAEVERVLRAACQAKNVIEDALLPAGHEEIKSLHIAPARALPAPEQHRDFLVAPNQRRQSPLPGTPAAAARARAIR